MRKNYITVPMSWADLAVKNEHWMFQLEVSNSLKVQYQKGQCKMSLLCM